MLSQVNGSTRILGIIGHPVRHSLSPAMQNAALKACGLDYVYVPFEVAPDGLENAVLGMKALGVAGFNVTIPYKTRIMPFLDGLDRSAEAAGAVNTVKNDSGRLMGYNTDGDGLVRSLATEFNLDLHGRSIGIIGAGGAARGAVASLCRAGVKTIMIANRTHERAVELVSALMPRYPGTGLSIAADYQEMSTRLAEVDLLVNTTSIGMQHDSVPGLRLDRLPDWAAVYDMVYAPPVTPLLRDAARRGLRRANGLGMLAAQGELAFAIWTGVNAPSGVMKSVLEGICAF